ncbi:MAG: TraB/GumN family protein [Deltaproteobacteria bacterium]|nr:TraB/GumN family protein [Deltaproteobacteria bacterium]
MRRSSLSPFWLVLLLITFLLTGCKKPPPPNQTAAPEVSALLPGLVASAPAPASAIAPAASAPAADRPSFLWKIDGTPPSWLLGTIHVPDPRVSDLPSSITQALASADMVLTEIPMDSASQLSMAPLLMLPKGKTLKSVLPEALYRRLERAFLAKGFPLEPLSSLKVWAMAAHVVLLDRMLVLATQKPLDAWLYEQAQSSGKKVGALETPQEQVAAFDGMSTAEQIHMLDKTLEQREENGKEGKDPIETLLVAWLSGSEEKMNATILDEYDPKDPIDKKMMKRLLLDRNEVMAERIAAKLKASPGQSMLFAVGTAHLVGVDSVVAKLQRRGVKVARAGAAP